MSQYLIAMHQPVGPVPPPEVLGPVMEQLGRLNQEMEQQGVWVFAAGLHDPSASTVIRSSHPGGPQTITDGPYVEGKEHFGGFTVIDVDDLDAALDWARRMQQIIGLPVEVRPVKTAADDTAPR